MLAATPQQIEAELSVEIVVPRSALDGVVVVATQDEVRPIHYQEA